MMKKLISTAILCSVIGSVSANPELGYMTFNTDNHNFINATIAIDALPTELADKKLKVTLGSITDFYRHNVKYNKQISSLRFKVTKDSSGKPIISVRSIREITADQLQAVVKLSVGSKKVYGIYDVQLGSDNTERHVALNLLNADYKPAKKRLIVNKSQRISPQKYQHKEVVIERSGNMYRVLSGSSISQIAMELLPQYPAVSTWQKLMEQLVAINPDAFVDGDINRLKSDVLLNLPEKEVGKTSPETISWELVSDEKQKVNKLTSVNKKRLVDQVDQTYREDKDSIELENYTQEIRPLEIVESEDSRLVRRVEQEPEKWYQIEEAATINKRIDAEVGRYQVMKGETISLIAIKLWPDYPKVNDWKILMDQLVMLNPEAFIGGDANRLRAGVELELPDPSQPFIDLNSEPDNWVEDQQPEITYQKQIRETYRVIKGETISLIAIRIWPDYPKINDWKVLMNKLVLMNPDAFIDGDANQLRSGVILTIPTQRDFEIESENQGLPSIQIPDLSFYKISSEKDSVERKYEKTYRVVKDDNLSVIAFKLLPDYQRFGGWYALMKELARLNPSVFVNNDIGMILEGTILKLPVSDAALKTGGNTDMHRLQNRNQVTELKRRRQRRNLVSNSYNQISQPPVVRAMSDRFYKVPDGHTLSMVAIALFPEFPEYGSWPELMQALYEINPNAFTDNDINQLRSNVELKLPDIIRPL